MLTCSFLFGLAQEPGPVMQAADNVQVSAALNRPALGGFIGFKGVLHVQAVMEVEVGVHAVEG